MEQHAVPQDITGFKFKLVGDMTLVQFGELAFGLIVGWIIWSSPIHVILRAPLAVFFAILGVGLAFVPVEERPMHVWIFNFFKSIYRPTYYIWKRNSINPLESPPKTVAAPTVPPPTSTALPTVPPLVPIEHEIPKTTGPWPYAASPSPAVSSTVAGTGGQPSEEKKPVEIESIPPPEPVVAAEPVPVEVVPTAEEAVENTAPIPPPVSVNELIDAREQKLSPPANTDPAPALTTTQQHDDALQKPMTIEELVKRREQMTTANDQKVASALVEAEKKVNELTDQNKGLLMQIDEIKNKLYAQQPNQDSSELTQDLDTLMVKKNALAGEIATVRDHLAGVRVAPVVNPSYQEQPVVVKKAPKVIVPSPKQAIVSLTAIPNVVNGLVLDANGKPLDSAILIIKDESGNSIRALRTNKVGQFIASTPLSNGNYSIEVEKNNYSFAPWPVALSGQVLDPIEIRAWAQPEEGAEAQS